MGKSSKTIFAFKTSVANVRLMQIVTEYRAKRLVYATWNHDNGSSPQRRFRPDGVVEGSVEHLRFLFFAGLTTLRNVSDEGYRLMAKNYHVFNWLFTKEVLLKTNKDVEVALKGMGFGHNKQWAPYWKDCASELWGKFDGDPSKLLNSFESINEFMRRKDLKPDDPKSLSFKGYGAKLMSLYALFLEELGIIKRFKDSFPVDVHIQNICLSNGIVIADEVEFYSDPLAEFLRQKLSEWCKRNKVSILELSHALWFLGSKVCVSCQRCSVTHLCPVAATCPGRVDTNAYWEKGRWVMGRVQKQHPQVSIIF